MHACMRACVLECSHMCTKCCFHVNIIHAKDINEQADTVSMLALNLRLALKQNIE